RADWTAPCDVRVPGDLEALFERVKQEWGGLDFLLHSIAFAPKEDLHGRVVDCSAEGFAMAMDVSCHSFMRMAKLAEPLMPNGGTLLTVTFYGSERVVEHYNLMGPVKAALESAVRRQNIRHNSRRKLAECGPHLGADVRRRCCGAASADARWSFA